MTQHANDKQEVEPALAKLVVLPKELGQVAHMAGDTGYCS